MFSALRHIDSIFLKRKIIQLTFFVTRKCNANCPFCFYLNNTQVKAKAAELSIDEIQKTSASMGKLLWLAFSGGEPYLRKDFVEIVTIFYQQNNPVFLLIPTNGLLPELIKEKTEQILVQCKNSVLTVKLSLDGLYDDHDKLRNTPGSFDKTMKTYRLLGKLLSYHKNFELGINTVFCSENQDKMDAIINFVMRLKNIKTHSISMIRGDLENQHFKKIDHKKYQHAINRLKNNLLSHSSTIYSFRGARLKAAQDILQRQLIHQTLLEQKQSIPCYAGKLNLVLSETGELFPCEILSSSFGNIRDCNYTIKTLTSSKNAITILDSIVNKHCYCTHECYFITNILFNAKLYPALIKKYIQL